MVLANNGRKLAVSIKPREHEGERPKSGLSSSLRDGESEREMIGDPSILLSRRALYVYARLSVWPVWLMRTAYYCYKVNVNNGLFIGGAREIPGLCAAAAATPESLGARRFVCCGEEAVKDLRAHLLGTINRRMWWCADFESRSESRIF